MRAGLFVVWLTLIGAASARATAQGELSSPRQEGPLPVGRTAEDVYRYACATCHGVDGRGSPKSIVGFDVPLPDFSDCGFATAEPDQDWRAVVHEGGPIRGLDRHMPAFGEALSQEEIALAIGHARTLCRQPEWPRGDLNLPRAFFTEKAFPENESVWATTLTRRGGHAVGNELIYERRLGARNQIEVNVPIDFQQDGAGHWNRGLGDLALAFKRTVYASLTTGGIGAAGMEVTLPTGKESLGLGNGYAVFEPFAMWGQILPRNAYLQIHGGMEFPADTTKAGREGYVRAALGTTVAQHGGYGRAWSPQVEVLWAYPQDRGSEWDVVPQVQITLSKLQHVMVAGGIRIPVSQRSERPRQGLVYLVWDWFDGGFFEFWR
jgi:hypothetical protein